MAYENMTYENILKRMIDRVTNKYPNLDYREGSIIFNALAPAALELAIMYTELNNALNESFVETASREYLLLGCEQMGMDITPFEASSGTHKGVFNIDVPIGSRWNLDLYNYEVKAFIDMEDDYFTYQLLCETPGVEPNSVTGSLIPIDYYPTNLQYAEVVECLIEGEDESTDEEIRDAYFDFVNKVSTDGNVEQYKHWCDEFDGIGNYKIFPLWNGDNTVKVSILDNNNGVANETLISEFQNYLDPGTTGMGDGVAPIGAFVTVTTASSVTIDISADIKLKDGYSDTNLIEQVLSKYLSDISYVRDSVSYMSVGSAILNSEGVDSVNNLTLNGGTADILIGSEQIPILGEVELVVK